MTSLHYILKNHLGSWTTIADAGGNVEQELSYDAWGSLRNPETWSGNATAAPMFDRGFTGHEHVTAFGLINMNGRCYDPLTSSFLSVDRYVQSPDNAQSFNRYSYCQNNPLRYVDPSGWQMTGGSSSYNSFHENWGVCFAQRAYTPRDFGLTQLSDADPIIAWMEENEMHGVSGGENPIIDPSGMTQSQIETFQKSMEFASDNSSLFRTMYELLDNSSVVYKILIGETLDNCPGQFNLNDKTITFRDERGLTEFLTYSEELFHAFQDENILLYNSNERDFEYEAKIAKFFMYAQIMAPINVVGNDSFAFTLNYFSPNGIDVYMPTAQTITGSYFLNGYFEGARQFAEWNRIHNIGKLNYQRNTFQPPMSLFRLFQ